MEGFGMSENVPDDLKNSIEYELTLQMFETEKLLPPNKFYWEDLG
jgi:hypothetical protein